MIVSNARSLDVNGIQYNEFYIRSKPPNPNIIVLPNNGINIC